MPNLLLGQSIVAIVEDSMTGLDDENETIYTNTIASSEED